MVNGFRYIRHNGYCAQEIAKLLMVRALARVRAHGRVGVTRARVSLTRMAAGVSLGVRAPPPPGEGVPPRSDPLSEEGRVLN